MEKITIKPTSKEIVIRGKQEDGHTDAFSYNYEGSASNGLGSLFIVGQVQPATEDTAYMINLVASLANREYYAQTADAPKEAFSKTLKKINDVLQDFFRNKDLKINIGIFAVAGENIYISRLGKFKIILGRDNQIVDILNNINLFNKEHIQEKEFSNIISGKIASNDRILAFYPSRAITAREKNIKAQLLKLNADDFAESLNEIKKTSEAFGCAALHVSIDRYTEPAIVKNPQPQELQEPKKPAIRTVLAKAPKKIEEALANPESLISVRPIPKQEETPAIQKPTPAPVTPEEKTPESNVYYPGNKNVEPGGTMQPPAVQPETLIRPTEFSSAKQNNLFDVILKKFKPSGVYIIGVGQGQGFSKKKILWTGGTVVAVIALAIIAKLSFAPSLPIPGIESNQNKAVTALIEQLQPQIELAKSYQSQNNLFEARRVLFESMSALSATNAPDSEKIDALEQEINSLLDQMDHAVESTPSLFYQISQDIGQSSIITQLKDKVLVFVENPEHTGGAILEVTAEGVKSTTTVKDFNPLYLIGNDQLFVLINSIADQIGSLLVKGTELKTAPLSLDKPAISMYTYQDNLYILSADNIYKIVDASSGKNNETVWLTKDATLPMNPLLIAVDGNVYVISENGILAKYYKGDKVAEVNTSIPVSKNSILLTTKDSLSLYLIDKEQNRIYVIGKEAGNLTKTLKISSDSVIVSGSIAEDETLYLLSGDNKVWKIKP